MDRYSEIRVERVPKGKAYTISFTDSFERNTRILTTYTPRLNERLDNIAVRFYGDPKKWFIIARANKEVRGSMYPTPGKPLVIPRI